MASFRTWLELPSNKRLKRNIIVSGEDVPPKIETTQLAVSSAESLNACGGLSSGMGSISYESGTGEAGSEYQVCLDWSEQL